MLIAYCTGLIAICTGLLIFATVFTMQNYWLLRQLSDPLPGKHDGRAEEQGRSVEYYDSGAVDFDDAEWTGPVTAYTPAHRNPS